MLFHIRYIDTSDWLQGKAASFWNPVIHLDISQYFDNKQKINSIYSVIDDKFYGTEEATSIINKSLYLKLRKLMEHYWKAWGYDTSYVENYAAELAQLIKYNLESYTWNPWNYIPSDINLVIVRRLHKSRVVWLGNAFYLGIDPEATETLNI